MGQEGGFLRGVVCSRSVPVQRDRPTSDIYVSVRLYFSIHSNGYELYCRDGTLSLRKLRMWWQLQRYLGVRDLTSEELQGVLSGGVPSFQAVRLR